MVLYLDVNLMDFDIILFIKLSIVVNDDVGLLKGKGKARVVDE